MYNYIYKYKEIYPLNLDSLWIVVSTVSRLGVVWPGLYAQEGQNFSLLHHVQTDSGTHTTSYRKGIVAFTPGGKATGALS
jgi:hypothetical protein